MISGGALFGKALANEGIEKAFVLCGGHVMPVFYGMRAAANGKSSVINAEIDEKSLCITFPPRAV